MSWKAYSSTVSIPGALKVVPVRATDVAGNVSADKLVTVQGALSLSTPTTTAKVATATAGATLKYQWKANGAAVSGATKSTQVVALANRGKKLTVTVTATKAGFTTLAKTSASSTALGTPSLSTSPSRRARPSRLRSRATPRA